VQQARAFRSSMIAIRAKAKERSTTSILQHNRASAIDCIEGTEDSLKALLEMTLIPRENNRKHA
jgi:hypothetical protein